jgi:secreted PhoX family phosphatase
MAAAGPLSALSNNVAAAHQGRADVRDPDMGGYGPLQPTPERDTGETLLALPQGFSYIAFGRVDDPMSDGIPTPKNHDGMAAFDMPDGTIRLVRNHEMGGVGQPFGPGPAYDPTARAGTTTLVFDPEAGTLLRDFVSLQGTHVNCAGGPTPWGSWLSCEETVQGRPTYPHPRFPNRQLGGYARDHGYVFEVPATAEGPVVAEPLKAMGRFVHEAAAVDPATGIVYETEHRERGGFYRFLPERPGDLAAGGRLQMLAVRGREQLDTSEGQRVGTLYPVYWVDIDEPDPPEADGSINDTAVFDEGFSKGGAAFKTLEGAWYGDGSIYFNATRGGDAEAGQVWDYRPRGRSGGTLRLLFESPSRDVLERPDNITVSPSGGILLCQDSDVPIFLRGLNRRGQIFDFARNTIAGFEDGEFAGATYSADGRWLFFNAQDPGITFAVTGPWERGAL